MSLQDSETTTPTTDEEPRIIGFESKPLPKSASPLELKTWGLLGAGILFFGFFLLNDFNRETLSPAKLQVRCPGLCVRKRRPIWRRQRSISSSLV